MIKWVFTNEELIQKALDKIEDIKINKDYDTQPFLRDAMIKHWLDSIERIKKRGQP